MSTKSKVLEKLEEYKPNYISGEILAKDLGISRTAIWKSIKSLESDGYKIESVTRKGYRLLEENDLLSEEGIRLYLNNKNTKIVVFDKVDSTNLEAKKLGIDGYKDNTLVVSDEQTKGRGRFGRNFSSPKGKGIYLSLVIKPSSMNVSDVSFSTILTVMGVVRALEKFTNQDIKIKWVNDLYVDNKKVSGILTELVSDIESGNIDFIVSGIGININAKESDFPEELRNIATSIVTKNTSRNKIIAEIANEVFYIFKNFDKTQVIKEYTAKQLLMNKSVYYEKDGENREGIVTGINADGCLVLKSNGSEVILNSGEVSVKWDRKKE